MVYCAVTYWEFKSYLETKKDEYDEKSEIIYVNLITLNLNKYKTKNL